MGRAWQEPESGLVAFGLGLLTDLRPPGAWESQPLLRPIVRLQATTPEEIAKSWSGRDAIGWEGTIDGARFLAERGKVGDYRFVHGAHPDERGAPATTTRAIHHLSPDAGLLRCAPADRSEPSWWRLVLDSVLFTVALIEGYEALHAAAVATPDGGGAIAITAAMGGGKSTLLSELLRRGLGLMADDVLVLEPSSAGGPPLAHPAPPLMTVPAARLPLLARMGSEVSAGEDEAGAPKPICTLEQECWIAVRACPRPLPLRSLVVLDRRRGAQLSLARIDDPLVPLIGAFMHFPCTPQRERARFELASVLAATARLWRLSADLDTPPEALADTLLDGVLDRGFRSTGAATHVSAARSRC